MSYSVYHQPQNVALADQPIEAVLRISWKTECRELLRAGDDDYGFSVARHVRYVTRGSIEVLDAIAAQQLVGRRGTLTFDLASDAAGKRIRLSDCSLGTVELVAAFDQSPSCRIHFLAEALPLCQDLT
jgi:hypothetical protein